MDRPSSSRGPAAVQRPAQRDPRARDRHEPARAGEQLAVHLRVRAADASCVVTTAGSPPPPPPPPAFTSNRPVTASGGSFTAPASPHSVRRPPLPAHAAGANGDGAGPQRRDDSSIPVRSRRKKDSSSQLIGLLVLLAGAAVAIWSYRSSAAGALGARGAGTEQIGGLGRFARAREGVAPRLG